MPTNQTKLGAEKRNNKKNVINRRAMIRGNEKGI